MPVIVKRLTLREQNVKRLAESNMKRPSSDVVDLPFFTDQQREQYNEQRDAVRRLAEQDPDTLEFHRRLEDLE